MPHETEPPIPESPTEPLASAPTLPPPTFAGIQEDTTLRPEDTRFLLFDFLLLFGFHVVFSALAYAIYTMVIPRPTTHQKEIWTLVISVATGCGVIALWLWIGRSSHRMSWSRMGFRPFALRDLLLWSGIFFPSVLAFTYLHSALLRALHLSNPTQDVASFFASHRPWWFQGLALFLILIVAPISEEMMYRGLLFRALQRDHSTLTAALWSGLLFGMIHIQPNTILPLAFLGFLLARCLAATGSLALPIALHAFNNFLAFLFLKWS